MPIRNVVVTPVAMDRGNSFAYDRSKHGVHHPLRTIGWEESPRVADLSTSNLEPESISRLKTLLRDFERTLMNSLGTTVPFMKAEDLAYYFDATKGESQITNPLHERARKLVTNRLLRNSWYQSKRQSCEAELLHIAEAFKQLPSIKVSPVRNNGSTKAAGHPQILSILRAWKDAVIWQWRVSFRLDYEGAPIVRPRESIVHVCATVALRENKSAGGQLDVAYDEDASSITWGGSGETSVSASAAETARETEARNLPATQFEASLKLSARSDPSPNIMDSLTKDSVGLNQAPIPRRSTRKRENVRYYAYENLDGSSADDVSHAECDDAVLTYSGKHGRQGMLFREAKTISHRPGRQSTQKGVDDVVCLFSDVFDGCPQLQRVASSAKSFEVGNPTEKDLYSVPHSMRVSRVASSSLSGALSTRIGKRHLPTQMRLMRPIQRERRLQTSLLSFPTPTQKLAQAAEVHSPISPTDPDIGRTGNISAQSYRSLQYGRHALKTSYSQRQSTQRKVQLGRVNSLFAGRERTRASERSDGSIIQWEAQDADSVTSVISDVSSQPDSTDPYYYTQDMSLRDEEWPLDCMKLKGMETRHRLDGRLAPP